MDKEKPVNIQQLAREVGLDRILCSCGNSADVRWVLEKCFNKIVEICKDGGSVRIKNFGTFKSKRSKSRKIKSSILEQDAIAYEQLVLKFYPSKKCKERMNKGKKDGKYNRDQS